MVIRKYNPKDVVLTYTDKDGEEHTIENFEVGPKIPFQPPKATSPESPRKS